MDAAIYKALSGAIVQMRRLEIAAQDLGNINTAGYKGQRLSFSEVLAGAAPASERPGGWVAISGAKTNSNAGEIYNTGNPFNLAIGGDGYFVVQTPRGERYTRNGSLTLRSDGTLVTTAGDPVLSESGPLQIDGNKFTVTPDGTVSGDQGEIGKLRIVHFINNQQVLREGGSLFQTLRPNAQDATDYQIVQGGLEQSNVSPIDSMVLMITNQRHFDAYERAIRMMDGTTEKMIAEAGR
jgi:flagellar basal-body rod protein FlgF